MKNTIFLAIASLFFSAAASAQSTVDSIAAKYTLVPMPAPLTIEKTFPVIGTYQLNTGTTTQAATTSTTADASVENSGMLTVRLDSVNRGMIWVEGLPQGTVKAYLKKSPSTYRILAQKSSTGKSVPEGTLVLDSTTNTLNIALGSPFNDADPVAIFGLNNSSGVDGDNTVEVKVKSKNAKTKAKVTYYTATKIVQDPTATDAATQGQSTFGEKLGQAQQAQDSTTQPTTQP